METAFDGLGNDALIDKPFTSHVDPFYQYHLGLSGLNENYHLTESLNQIFLQMEFVNI